MFADPPASEAAQASSWKCPGIEWLTPLRNDVCGVRRGRQRKWVPTNAGFLPLLTAGEGRCTEPPVALDFSKEAAKQSRGAKGWTARRALLHGLGGAGSFPSFYPVVFELHWSPPCVSVCPLARGYRRVSRVRDKPVMKPRGRCRVRPRARGPRPRVGGSLRRTSHDPRRSCFLGLGPGELGLFFPGVNLV